jgi:hypothetical protein
MAEWISLNMKILQVVQRIFVVKKNKHCCSPVTLSPQRITPPPNEEEEEGLLVFSLDIQNSRTNL